MLPSLICTLPMSTRQMPFRFIKARHVLLFLCLLAFQLIARTASGAHWRPAPGTDSPGPRRILMREGAEFRPSTDTYVITHGLHGISADDRFHQLADAIADRCPSANILILDWTTQSRKTNFLGFVCPITVSRDIDTVGDWFAKQLQQLQPELSRTTFIGESFGNCINARIASRLGNNSRFLIFNPASTLGGYQLPDLRPLTARSWSFATFSTFDCQDVKSDVSFFLQTPAGADESQQHTFGVTWLRNQILLNHNDWLNMNLEVQTASPEQFDGVAELDGTFLPQALPRKKPAQKSPARPQSPGSNLIADRHPSKEL